MERDLIEEINARTKFPITKQDSYGHAIYHGAKKTKNVRKQGRVFFINNKYQTGSGRLEDIKANHFILGTEFPRPK